MNNTHDIMIGWISDEKDPENVVYNFEIYKTIIDNALYKYDPHTVKTIVVVEGEHGFRLLEESISHNLDHRGLDALVKLYPNCNQLDIANEIKCKDQSEYLQLIKGMRLQELTDRDDRAGNINIIRLLEV